MGTAASRMNPGSGSTGSGLVQTTTTETTFTTVTTTTRVSQTTQDPMSSDPQNQFQTLICDQVGRLFEEDPIQDVRNRDIFDAISKKIRLLEEIPAAFCKLIWENKEAIAEDPVMQELVREFINTILATSRLYNRLAECLIMESDEHDILQKVLRDVPDGSPPLDEEKLETVDKTLRDFVKNADQDPFKDLQPQFESLLQRYEQLRKKLDEKIKELGRKRKANKVWSAVSKSLMAALSAAAVITCVVAVVVAPPIAGMIVTPLAIYAKNMSILGEMMLSSFSRQEQNLEEKEKITEKIRKHSVQADLDLQGIRNSVEGLNRFRSSIVNYINNYKRGKLKLADLAEMIGTKEEELLRKLDDLVKEVDGCLTKLREQTEDLKKTLL